MSTPLRSARAEPLLPLPWPHDRVPLATQIRSTVLASSLAVIEELGLGERYFSVLPQVHHEIIRTLVVGAWIPIEIGVAHYHAIQSLEITDAQARVNGRRIADRVQRSYLATLIRAVGFGITPWSILPRTQSVIDRLLMGASAAVYRLGPKDARVEIHGAPIARFSYVRSGWAGMMEGGLDLVSRKTYCRDVSPVGTTTVAAYHVTWA